MRKYLDANIVLKTKDINKNDWLELRKSGIGGSDAASVLGFSPYRSSMSVYLEKINHNNKINNLKENIVYKNALGKDLDEYMKENLNEEVSYKMELGNKLKDFVASEFTLKTNKKVRNINAVLRNDKYPFAIANIDKAVIGEKAFLECKVTNSYLKKSWQKEVPIHYKIQMNHYMAVTGATHCYVAVLIGNEELIIHKIERDEEYISEIMSLEKMFWENCILGDDIPMPDGSNDYSNFLNSFYKESKEESLILFEQEKLLQRYDEISEISKEIDTERKTIEQYIKLQMKEYETCYIGDRKITWKNQSRNTVDTKKLKIENPKLIENYIKTTNSRVFKIH